MSRPDAPTSSDAPAPFPPPQAPPPQARPPQAPPPPPAVPVPTRPPGPPPFWAYTPPAPPPPVRPRWRRVRRACTVLAVVGVLVAAAGAVVAVQSYRDARTPQAAVRAYFAALTRGDAAAALGTGQVPGGGRLLVTDAVLRATLAQSPIDDVTTGSVTRRGDAATVEVRYRLGGTSPQQVDDTVDLLRTDDRWQLRRSAVPLTLSVDNAASWAAVPSTTPFAVPGDDQLAFPGAVPVFFRTSLLEVASTSRVVRFADAGNDLPVSAQVSADGRAHVVRTVSTALTACVVGGTGVDPFCPQPAAGRAGGAVLRSVPRSFAGTLQGLDSMEVDVGVGSSSAGTLTVSGTVAVKGAWQVLDYDNVADGRSGSTSLTYGATVPVAAPDTLDWERS